MAIMITDECINCGACEPECPNTAIYEGALPWKWSEGTAVSASADQVGKPIDPAADQTPYSEEFYYIAPEKCTECTGFHEEPQCAAVCPVDCCIPDPERVESKETLAAKKQWLHGE